MNENIIVPHPLHPLLADRNRGRGRPDSNNRKNSDKGVFCCFFATIFFTVQNGRTFSGGCNFLFIYLLIFFFFFFLGGGVGVANPYLTYITKPI